MLMRGNGKMDSEDGGGREQLMLFIWSKMSSLWLGISETFPSVVD
jgi:hypothetical protein